MPMHPTEIESALNTLVLLVDTREQPTAQAQRRLKQTGLPIQRHKLDFGDYSGAVILNGEFVSFSDRFAIERKMSLDELAACYTHDRKRFEREFERAKAADAKLYLLIENGSIDKVIQGTYRSKFTPKAFLASLMAWLARYNCQVVMCSAENSGRLIKEIVYREVKERLINEE